MNTADIEKALELIGKEVYTIETPFDGRPYIKAVKILSVEIFGNPPSYAVLKTAHEGSFRYGWGQYYESYEKAEKIMLERSYPDKTRLEPIKTCPICGSHAQILQYAYKFQIECNKCGLSTRPERKLKDAIKLWNERKDNKNE